MANININTPQDNEVSVQLFEGVSKKSGKPYKAIKITIGKWSKLVFPRSAFELDYITEILSKS
jgi:hypothetical protein